MRPVEAGTGQRQASAQAVDPVVHLAACGDVRSLSHSLRRLFVDDFYHRHVGMLPPGNSVLDVGGNKIGKRGGFDIGAYPVSPLYCNLSPAKQPDVICDATALPFPTATFDTVICAELLEHVPQPVGVLKEAARVLKPNGRLLLTAPFIFRIHADPVDFCRYTDYYWETNLSNIGFTEILVEYQGFYWTVAAEMMRSLLYQQQIEGRISSRFPVWASERLSSFIKKLALKWDARDGVRNSPYFRSFTTGFGISAVKT